MVTIDQAISASERRANRLWLISIVWATVMVIIATIFGISIYQFNETRNELNGLKQTAAKLIADLQKTKEELSLLKKTGSAQSRQLFALSLQMRGADKLTSEQEEFVKRQADQALLEEPTPDSLTLQANSELIQRRFQDAYVTYTEALSLKGDFAPAYAGRAAVDLNVENFVKEDADLTQVLTIDKDVTDRPMLLWYRANARVRIDKIAEAEQDIAEAAQTSDPVTKGKAINTRGLIKVKKQDWQGAEKDFRAAAQLHPDLARSSLENIGLIYLAQSNWTMAYNWSVEVSKMPDKSGGWMWMIEALAAEKLGKPEERKAAVREYMTHGGDQKQNIDKLSFFLPDDFAHLAGSWVLPPEKK